MSSVKDYLRAYSLDDDDDDDCELDLELHRDTLSDYIYHIKTSPESTQQTRISCAHSWLKWLETRGETVEDVERPSMYDYISHLQNNGLADTSIGSRVDTVTMMHLWGAQRGEFPNPFADFDLEEETDDVTRSVPQQVRVLKSRSPDADAIVSISKEQVEEVIEHSGTPRTRNQLINRLLWQTGLRASELASVKIEHIDRDNRSIQVKSAKTDIDDDHYWRTVYYQPNLDYSMYEWLDRGGRAALYNGSEPLEDDGYLLVTQQSRQMRPSMVSRIVKESAKRAGINEVLYIDGAGKQRWLITAHTLRHSYATYCANETDMPLQTLKRLMGHKSVDTTLQYISQSEDVVRRHAHEHGPQ